MRAVIFDLYCTLVPGNSSAKHADARQAMGKALRLDPDVFSATYHEAWPQRLRGELGGLRESIRAIAMKATPQPPRPRPTWTRPYASGWSSCGQD
jgi:hypothetical protein